MKRSKRVHAPAWSVRRHTPFRSDVVERSHSINSILRIECESRPKGSREISIYNTPMYTSNELDGVRLDHHAIPPVADADSIEVALAGLFFQVWNLAKRASNLGFRNNLRDALRHIAVLDVLEIAREALPERRFHAESLRMRLTSSADVKGVFRPSPIA